MSYNKPISKPSSKYVNLNHFNYLSQPISSLQDLVAKQWDIKSLQISEHGKTGVIFIQTTEGSFVLKMNNQAPIDSFFNILAAQINLNVTEVQIVDCYQEFFATLVFRIQRFCEKDQMLSARLRSRMDFPFYQLIQYIPSISLLQVGRKRFQKYQLQPHKLQSLGICIGFDLLTNNSDRFKLGNIWPTSDGNISNVLIRIPKHYKYNYANIKDRQNTQIQLGEYFFIDHSGCLLDVEKNALAAANYQKYIQKVIQLQDKIFYYLKDQIDLPDQFNYLIDQIQLYTKHCLTENQIKCVIDGIIFCTQKFIKIFQQQTVHEILKVMKKGQDIQTSQNKIKTKKLKQQKYWNQYWNQDLAKIKLNTLQLYHLKVSTKYIINGDLVKLSCDKVQGNLQKIGRNRSSSTISQLVKGSTKSIISIDQINNLQAKTPRQIQQKQKSTLNDHIYQRSQKNQYGEQQNFQNLNQNQSQIELKSQVNMMGLKSGGRNRLKQKLQAFQKKNYNQSQDNND